MQPYVFVLALVLSEKTLQAFTNLDMEVGGDLAQHVTVAFKIGQSCYQRSDAAYVNATVG